MPELNDHGAAFDVHGVGNCFPTTYLFCGIAARRIGIALRLRGDLRGFSDYQAGGSALGVIFRRKRAGD